MPTFPFRRSPGQDLRDLFAHDRLQVQANDLGYSSIGPGEGAAEVRNAAGQAVALFGERDGLLGFLVPNGSGWQTWEAAAQEIAAAAVSSGTSGFVTSATHNALAGRVGAAEGVNDTQTTRLDSHASRLGASEGDIATLQSGKVSVATHNTLAGRVGAVEGVNGTQAQAITALQNIVQNLAQNMSAVFGRANSLQLDVESLGKPYRPPLQQG